MPYHTFTPLETLASERLALPALSRVGLERLPRHSEGALSALDLLPGTEHAVSVKLEKVA